MSQVGVLIEEPFPMLALDELNVHLMVAPTHSVNRVIAEGCAYCEMFFTLVFAFCYLESRCTKV